MQRAVFVKYNLHSALYNTQIHPLFPPLCTDSFNYAPTPEMAM